jgi:tetratricopeptide (TPR) repeat protein
MKRIIALAGIVAMALIGVVLVDLVASRQRDYRALLVRGDDALRKDETFDAIEAYSGAIALRPDSTLAYLRRGETYRHRADRGDLEAAARDFRKAASLERASTRPLEELGDVAYQLQRYDRAADAYERSLRVDDHAARIGYKLALARYRNNDIDGALAALDQTVRVDDRMADAYCLMGVCFREKGRAADALRALQKAVALSPALIPAREELADIFAALDRRSDHLEQLQLLASLDRDHPERPVAVALAHARSRPWDAAVVTLTAALERMPDDPTLYAALGQVWLESAQARGDNVDLSKAREALERVASTPAATSEMLVLAGRAALEGGDVAAAESHLQAAAARFPVDPAAPLLFAGVAERQNHLDNARRALLQYEALVVDDPDLVGHATRIATLSARLDDLDTAAEWIKRGLDKDPQNGPLQALARRVNADASDRSNREAHPPEN